MGTEVTLRDGTRAITWALLPSDRDEVARGYDQLSPESKYHRFLAAVPHLTDSLLTQLVDEVDGVEHVALVLFVFDEPDVGTPAGIGRMVRYPHERDAADVAVTVAEEFRGRGVASALLQSLLVHRPPGVRRILTEITADNAASLAMLERLGPTTVVPHEDNRLTVTVELPPIEAEAGVDSDDRPAVVGAAQVAAQVAAQPMSRRRKPHQPSVSSATAAADSASSGSQANGSSG